MNKTPNSTSSNAESLNAMLEQFTSTIGNSISVTQDNMSILLENEEKIKELIGSNEKSTEDIDIDCKDVQQIVKTLVEVLLAQRVSNEESVKVLKEESANVKELNEVLIAENEGLQVDELTELGNRHAFNKKFKELLSDYYEKQDHLSFAILDIDDFKKINDRYGHSGGDAILKFLAKFLKKNIKDDGFVYRFGGEEFVIISKHSRLDLKGILDNILQLLNATKLRNSKKVPMKMKLTFSGGVSSMNPHDKIEEGEEFADLYDRADAFLYEVKNAGKNAVK